MLPRTTAWRLLLPLCLTSTLALSGCLTDDGGENDGGGVRPRPECPGGFLQDLVDLMNEERAQEGLDPLDVDLRLVEMAQAHSEDMAATATLSHTGSDGSTPADRAVAAGFPYSNLGENVAAGQPDAAEVVSDWMGSVGHRANILGPFTHVGCGLAYASSGPYLMYWTANFGTPTDGGDEPEGGCHPE